MAPRSTRNKIRHQAKEALDAIERVIKTLYNIDALADKQSKYINEKLPVLVTLTDEYRRVFERFRKGL